MAKKILTSKDQVMATKDMVESGAYFEESRKWYVHMCVSPISNIMSYFIFLAGYVIALGFFSYFIYSMFPIKIQKRIVIMMTQDPDYYINVKHLKDLETPTGNIVKALAEHYVIKREEFIKDEIDKTTSMAEKKKFVSLSSGLNVYMEFRKNEIESYNAALDDFLMSDIETHIEINEFSFVYPDNSIVEDLYNKFIPTQPPNTVSILFTAHNSAGASAQYKADLSYSFHIGNQDAKGPDAKVHFLVLSYNKVRLK